MKIHFEKPVEIQDTEIYKKFEIEYSLNSQFLADFTNLRNFSGRIISFITDKKCLTFHAHLLENSVKTMQSIKLCCSIGSFADANSLIRRLRDDLLLYVYLLSIINQREPFTKKSLENLKIDDAEKFAESFLSMEFNTVLSADEQAVEAWLTSSVETLPPDVKKKLSFANYMQVLRKDEKIKKILNDYNLKDYWGILSARLNNYMHNNGIKYTLHNTVRGHDKDLEIYLQNINIRISYILSIFLVLISMIDSALMCSGEIEDYMDMGLEPHENCQYEIAPFIQNYIDEKVAKLHPELKQYLKDNNNYGMIID
ncbi:hypothetical protein [Flavobacterium luteolum]|uniref:hypothetical protein n=1 Tax=Flavobacterium luteolum TaxID=3003259 RepID=UPI00248D71B2|nr:hypothetical protein [Flavobacterium luteolum]